MAETAMVGAMRILWHGVAPWQPTGYGTQAAIWCRKLRDAGHHVYISAQGGNDTCQITDWQGIPVYPQAKDIGSVEMVTQGHLEQIKPDLVITCYDNWAMGLGDIFAAWKTVAWVPVDTTWTTVGSQRHGLGISLGDKLWLQRSKAQPLAMSQHGKRMLEHAGFPEVPCIPHGIDTVGMFKPLTAEERTGYRSMLGGAPQTFMVGINGTNVDRYRKSLPEQMLAFARFHAKHPNSQLHIHSQLYSPGSVHLGQLASSMGLDGDTVKISNQYAIATGMFPQQDLVRWYGCMDVLMNCSRGEGFGLASIEAQACGTPVILTNGHTGPELVGPGWLVGGQEFWNETHAGLWWTPSIKGMHDALCKARSDAAGLRDAARRFAEGYDAEMIWPLWEKLLGEL